ARQLRSFTRPRSGIQRWQHARGGAESLCGDVVDRANHGAATAAGRCGCSARSLTIPRVTLLADVAIDLLSRPEHADIRRKAIQDLENRSATGGAVAVFRSQDDHVNLIAD